MSNPEEKPFSESHLESPEYRKRLMRKLNTLIAVLEVACAKVRRSLTGTDPDTERLNRIHKNLQDTLQVCLRAKQALERCESLPKGLPTNLASLADLHRLEASEGDSKTPAAKKPDAHRNTVRSDEEKVRLDKLGPIEARERQAVDLDELCRKLLG